MGQTTHLCTICGKDYARSDVLSKHMARKHDQPMPRLGRPRRAACNRCRQEKRACDGIRPRPCTRCRDAHVDCLYTNGNNGNGKPKPHTPIPDARVSENGSSARTSRQSTSARETSSIGASLNDAWSFERNANIGQSADDSTLFSPLDAMIPNAGFTDTSNQPIMPGSMGHPNHIIDWSTLFGLESPDNTFMGWDIHQPNNELSLNDIFGIQDFEISEGSATLVGANEPHMSRNVDEREFASLWQNSGARVNNDITEQGGNAPWPSVVRALDSRSYTFFPDAEIDNAANLGILSERIPESSRKTMTSIVSESQKSMWQAIDVTHFPSTAALTLCVNMYLQHFQDFLPIIEKSTFKMTENAPLITMAMAALGSLFDPNLDTRFGLVMSELVRRAIIFIQESDRRYMFETNVVQANLLQMYFGFFSGLDQAHQQSEASHGSLITAFRRMHLLGHNVSVTHHRKPEDAVSSPEEVFASAKEDRRRARLGWGIYLLDAQLASFFGFRPHLALSEIKAPFPSMDSLQGTSGNNLPSFHHILNRFLSQGVSSMILDELGYNVLSHTLYRLCVDACDAQTLYRDPQGYEPSTLDFPPNMAHPPDILLDEMANHIFRLSTPLNYMLVSCPAIAHHRHLRCTYPGFLGIVRSAAGRSARPGSRAAADNKLSIFMQRNHRATRTIFAHAAMLMCLLHRYAFDTPAEVVWLFDAALSMWCILRLSNMLFHGPQTTNITWTQTRQVDQWITYGGQVTIQGLGDSSSMTLDGVLKHFITRLETASWGLADKYTKVLKSLLS